MTDKGLLISYNNEYFIALELELYWFTLGDASHNAQLNL